MFCVYSRQNKLCTCFGNHKPPTLAPLVVSGMDERWCHKKSWPSIFSWAVWVQPFSDALLNISHVRFVLPGFRWIWRKVMWTIDLKKWTLLAYSYSLVFYSTPVIPFQTRINRCQITHIILLVISKPFLHCAVILFILICKYQHTCIFDIVFRMNFILIFVSIP